MAKHLLTKKQRKALHSYIDDYFQVTKDKELPESAKLLIELSMSSITQIAIITLIMDEHPELYSKPLITFWKKFNPKVFSKEEVNA
jgi:hypothetical protein